MKKGLLLFISCLFISAGINAQNVATIAFVGLPDTMYLGSELTIKATVTPANAANKALTWASSDPTKIQIVSNTDTVCKVKVLAEATNTTITATAADGGGATLTSGNILTIYPPVSGIVLNERNLKLGVGEMFYLNATVVPEFAQNKAFTWESVDENIATIFHDGKVLAKKIGKTLIIATTADGGIKDTCVVTVDNREVKVTDVVMDHDSIQLTEGKTFRLNAAISPDAATNKNVNWTSQNSSIAEVTGDGFVTAKKTGRTLIFVTTVEGGKKDSCIVQVTEKLITINSDTTKTDNGTIGFSLDTAANAVPVSGTIVVQFPEGITLDAANTKLTDAFASSLALNIAKTGANIWTIQVGSKTLKSALRVGVNSRMINIAYTVDKSVKNGVYDVLFIGATIKMDNSTEIEENNLTGKIKLDITQGNDLVENQNVHAYFANNNLYVDTPQAETISVYSFSGSLLLTKNKTEGEVVFNVNTQEQVLILKGSSGWVKKIAK